MKLVVTGGAGFIGSCFVRMALSERWAEQVVNLDKLTYAGNLENLLPVADHPGYSFVQGDITDAASCRGTFRTASRRMQWFTSRLSHTLTGAFTHLLL